MGKDKKLNPQIQLDPATPLAQHKPHGWTEDEIDFYFNRALNLLNTENFTTASEYIDLLVNQCLAEKHWSDAFTAFLERVKSMGLEIETDQKGLQSVQEKLFYWRTVRMMIHAAGLGRYEEEIMKYEVAKFYQPINPMPTMGAPRTQREVPYARPRKPAAPKRKSIFTPEPKPIRASQPKAKPAKKDRSP